MVKALTPVTIKLTETSGSFHHKVLTEVRYVLNKAMIKSVNNIKKESSAQLGRLFQFSNVYSGLVGGPLNVMLGIPQDEAKSRIDGIIASIVNNMQFNFSPLSIKGRKLHGGLTIGLLQADFQDILSLPEASYSSNGKTIPWLEWLLLRGDQIIITGYDIDFGNFANSRSGSGIMVKNQNAAWRIPPEYSGLINDNWLTRIVDRGMKLIESILTRIVERNIRTALNVI